jgi:hypothetical protein
MMQKKRLETVLRAVRDPNTPVNAFLADTLVDAIRDAARSGVHLIVFDADGSGDSVDRLAEVQRRTRPHSRV